MCFLVLIKLEIDFGRLDRFRGLQRGLSYELSRLWWEESVELRDFISVVARKVMLYPLFDILFLSGWCSLAALGEELPLDSKLSESVLIQILIQTLSFGSHSISVLRGKI